MPPKFIVTPVGGPAQNQLPAQLAFPLGAPGFLAAPVGAGAKFVRT